MGLEKLSVGFLLLLSWVIRPILYKPAAQRFPLKLSAAFTSSWLILSLVISFPFFYHLLEFNGKNALFSPYILLAIYKGITLFYLISLQQSINKTSTSSSVFLSFIALAIGALANNIFFNESLGAVKVLCILGFGVLGYLFIRKGDAKRLSPKKKKFFIITTLIMASYTVSDHLAIPQVGWYSYLLVSSVVMFLVCVFNGISKSNIKTIFCNKLIIIAGLFYSISEFFVIYVSINILPVSIVAVFLRLSVPVVMVISAIKYKEQSVKSQLLFGVVAIALALPIILIK